MTRNPTGVPVAAGEPESLFRAAAETASDCLLTVAADGTVGYANPATERVLGYRPADVVGEPVGSFLPVRTREEGPPLPGAGDAGDGPVDILASGADGREVPLAVTVRHPPDDGSVAVWRLAEREGDVRERLERYETVIESVGDGVYELDDDGCIVSVNEAALDQTGYDREALLGEHVSFLFDDEAVRRGRAAVGALRADADRPYVEFEGKFETADGEALDGEVRLVVREEGGEFAGTVGILRDVTERKTQRRELRRSRAKYQGLIDAAPDAIFVADPESGTIIETNEAAAELLDRPREEILGMNQLALHPTGEEEAYRTLFERHVAAEAAVFSELSDGSQIEVEDAAGRRIPVEINAKVTEVEGDRLVQGIFRDISARVERERALREEKAFTEALFDAFPDLLYAFDRDGSFLRWNDRFAEVTGYDDEEIEAMDPLEFIAPEDREKMDWAIDQVLEEGRTGTPEARVIAADGSTVPYTLSGAPIRDEDGAVQGLAGVGRDVSARKEREDRLERQNERLEQLNRINSVIRDIDQALVGATTRGEIASAVCDRLAASEPYLFAWIGEQDHATETLSPTATAGGAEAYLEEITVRTDDSPTGRGPAGLAVRTREVQVTQDVAADPAFDIVSDLAEEHGFESVAAVPLVYGDSLYGVLVVYSDRPAAFGDLERAVLSELGETIGYAINAVRARQALVAEQVVELEVAVASPDHFYTALSAAADCTVSFEGAAMQADESWLYYTSVEGADADRVLEVAADFPRIEHARVVSEDGESCLLEVGLEAASVFTTLADHGAVVRSAVAENGESRFRVELPRSGDVRAVVETFETLFGEADLLAQREVERPRRTRRRFTADLTADLTDRQQTALETAFYAGFFAWPRESTGEEIADLMDVSPPTFHKHLRVAERKLLGAVLDRAPDERG